MVATAPIATQFVIVQVPGKINLTLRSSACRSDGYHELATVFQAVSVYDTLRAEWAEPGHYDVQIEGKQAELVPSGPANLAIKAARLLASAHKGIAEYGCSMRIHKNIPVAGGMAGGSADAAAALIACATLWGLNLTTNELLELGAQLGADVPFCLLGGTALGTGRGDRLTPVLTRGKYHWVLALSNTGLSTPEVFKRFDELDPQGTTPLVIDEALLAALATGDPDSLGTLLSNDLEPAALQLRPELGRIIDASHAVGTLGHVVSGSGPTIAFLVADQTTAALLARHLSERKLVDDAYCVLGPVPGARVI